MTKYKIEFERNKCVGTTACIEACPENWSLQEDGKSKCKLKIISEEQLKNNLNAAKACPMKAIHIIELKTNKKLI